MAALLQIASDIFLLAVKFICDPGVVKAEQNTTPIKHKSEETEPFPESAVYKSVIL